MDGKINMKQSEDSLARVVSSAPGVREGVRIQLEGMHIPSGAQHNRDAQRHHVRGPSKAKSNNLKHKEVFASKYGQARDG